MSPRRLRERIALGAVLVGLLGLPALLVLGAGALALSGAGALAFVGVGALALRERDASTPAAPRGVRLATRVAVDEAMLGFMQLRTAVPQLQELSQIAGELETELAHSERIALHAHLAAPPPIDKCELRSESVQELTFESLCFDSGYEPPPGSAGRTRFLSYRANRTAHAALFEVDPRAPWLVCLHGYRMGSPRSNFRLFDPARIARPLGINLAALCLPLHGPRTVGGRSGDRFLDGRVLDTRHALAQSIWDARRLIGWLRDQGAGPIGLYGVSLGSWPAAVVAGLDARISGLLLGLPLVDAAEILWRHGPPGHLRAFAERGATREAVARLLDPLSPLDHKPRVAPERRAIYAAIADRIVPPDQARRLHDSWGGADLLWAHGGHLTFHLDPRWRGFERAALRRMFD
jgi:hypothetical protein